MSTKPSTPAQVGSNEWLGFAVTVVALLCADVNLNLAWGRDVFAVDGDSVNADFRLEPRLRLSLVNALGREQFVGDVVASEGHDEAKCGNGKAEPAEIAGQALEFIGSHWDLAFPLAALFYSGYVFGYSRGLRRCSAKPNVGGNLRAKDGGFGPV